MQIILRPIQDLSNEEKAKLLHLLLSNNIRGFLGNLEQHARNTIHFSESIRVSWAGTTLSAEQWIELARKATQVIDEKRNELAAQPEIFAQELFTGIKVYLPSTS